MDRFYVPPPWADLVAFSPAQARQLTHVLRRQPGDFVEVFDGGGAIRVVELTRVTPELTGGRVYAARTLAWPAPWRPVLCLSLIRPQRFEWAIEKATELGAWSIVPLLTERTVRGGEEISSTRLSRWKQIAVEAAEQCGSAYLPQIEPPCPLAEALKRHAGAHLFAWEGEGARPSILEAMADVLPVSMGRSAPEVAIYIGPEGGFSDEELQAAIAAGCTPVSLGPRILRSETAALAALALVGAAAADTPNVG